MPIIPSIPLGALIAIAAAKGAPRGVLAGGPCLLALAALGNAGFGAYHAGVEWNFWQGPTDCTGPIGNLGSAGSLLDRLDTVKVVRCDEVQWRFLGISLAGYNVLISLLMAAIAAWGIAKSTEADPSSRYCFRQDRRMTSALIVDIVLRRPNRWTMPGIAMVTNTKRDR